MEEEVEESREYKNLIIGSWQLGKTIYYEHRRTNETGVVQPYVKGRRLAWESYKFFFGIEDCDLGI